MIPFGSWLIISIPSRLSLFRSSQLYFYILSPLLKILPSIGGKVVGTYKSSVIHDIGKQSLVTSVITRTFNIAYVHLNLV